MKDHSFQWRWGFCCEIGDWYGFVDPKILENL